MWTSRPKSLRSSIEQGYSSTAMETMSTLRMTKVCKCRGMRYCLAEKGRWDSRYVLRWRIPEKNAVVHLSQHRYRKNDRRIPRADANEASSNTRRGGDRASGGSGVGNIGGNGGMSHGNEEKSTSGRATLVWFKHDLRTDDHPGLQKALDIGAPVVPYFCLDPERYWHVHSFSYANALSRALESLRRNLRNIGSDLVVAIGNWEEELPKIMKDYKISTVLGEEEIETEWRAATSRVVHKAPEDIQFLLWNADLFAKFSVACNEVNSKSHASTVDAKNKDQLPLHKKACDTTFHAWKQQWEGRIAPAFNPPDSLHSLPVLPHVNQVSPGEIPTAREIYDLITESRRKAAKYFGDDSIIDDFDRFPLSLQYMSSDSDEDQIIEGRSPDFEKTNDDSSLRMDDGVQRADNFISKLKKRNGTPYDDSDFVFEDSEVSNGSAWEAELAAELATGEGPVMKALQCYLSFVETTGSGANTRWQWRLGAAISKFDVPASPDGCFPALFSRALSLGVVSRRRIYAEASQMLHEEMEVAPKPGILNYIGWLLTSSGGAARKLERQRKALGAVAAVEAAEFHEIMAREREGTMVHGGAILRHWKWRGVLLTDYMEAKAKESNESAPAIVLVHGFGAFSEHWRDNVTALAAEGYDVYAPTLPGYGRAEKPAAQYGQDLWRDFVADFIVEVVQRPVIIAGNSIGGFIVSSVAADFPYLVKGLVLVNSAGLLQEGYAPPTTPPPAPSPPLFIVEAMSRALFAFLQGNVADQLRRLYPVNPSRADEWLGKEIKRASEDPGALGVFRSVFFLPRPRALNYLVAELFGGPTLVLQGAKDPLNDARGRAETIDRLCENAEIELLNAGHCCHDEVPEAFNAALLKWIDRTFANEHSSDLNSNIKSRSKIH